MKVVLLVALPVLLAAFVVSDDDYDDDDYDQDSLQDDSPCDSGTNCLLPNCSCFGRVPFSGDVKQLPQFVMVTFDDAITTLNVKTYRQIAKGSRNSNGCPLTMTFFVSHEYNDYEFVNEMYKAGHEIAVHSITHESSTDMWKRASEDRWQSEMAGMRTMLSKYALVPQSEIKGHRAPFLQTAGDGTFKVLRENGFSYDSSMPTRAYMDPPLWPYTLDFGFRQDCQIQPCPKSNFPGLWVVPMVQWLRKSVLGNREVSFHCSMLDACTPYPTNATDTLNYMMENFERHYKTNRAPFPVFLHEAWIRDKDRLEGFILFLKTLLKREDVFVVSAQEVLAYMRHPVPLVEYRARKSCLADSRPKAGSCNPRVCNYPKRRILMKSCVTCPKRFPWLDNPNGLIIKN